MHISRKKIWLLSGIAVLAPAIFFIIWLSSPNVADLTYPAANNSPGTSQTLPQNQDGASDHGRDCRSTFAVIGDFGLEGQPAAEVADLVKSWKPDFVVTTGDNNYPNGRAETMDQNLGQYYHEFINPYRGSYGPGADVNRFFPTLGNHDWHSPGARPYLDFFDLPGNERYYDVAIGPVHIFALNSSSPEPDGISSSSKQALWLRAQLAASTSPWKIVVLHHAPYTSGSNHGSTEVTRWPYKEWGADLVLAGHEHVYERLEIDGLTYIVNGVGGGAIYGFGEYLPGSKARSREYGAMKIEATPNSLTSTFHNRSGTQIDSVTLTQNKPNTTCGPLLPPLN